MYFWMNGGLKETAQKLLEKAGYSNNQFNL